MSHNPFVLDIVINKSEDVRVELKKLRDLRQKRNNQYDRFN